MAEFDEVAVRSRLTADLKQIQRDIYERTQGEQAITPSMEAADGTGISSEQGDEANAVAEYDRNQAMLANDRALERQIAAALERLDTGKYGICENCGKPINPRRLEALPYATLCVDCQALAERARAREA
ncbi:MAG TPA: TraR/DksA C4-type zinc finger protein [Ktedonobacterales bacterium]